MTPINTFSAKLHLAELPPLPDLQEPQESQVIQKVEKKTKAKQGKDQGQSEELKVTDKIKIYTGVVPDLENGKDKLKEILEQDYDQNVRETLTGFIEQLEQMQIAMLEFAKVAIQNNKVAKEKALVDPSGLGGAIPSDTVKITASMINGPLDKD